MEERKGKMMEAITIHRAINTDRHADLEILLSFPLRPLISAEEKKICISRFNHSSSNFDPRGVLSSRFLRERDFLTRRGALSASRLKFNYTRERERETKYNKMRWNPPVAPSCFPSPLVVIAV